MKKKKFYIWCADYATNRGEGILANLYLKKLVKYFNNSEIYIEDLYTKNFFSNFAKYKKYKKKNIIINHSFVKKYIYPILSIIKVWKKYISGYKIVYINFLPLWNFFLFAFLPKKILLGPITGSKYTGKIYNINSFLRKYFLNYFYFISIFFIKKKYNKLIFSTDLLKNYFAKHFSSNNLLFNFQLIELKLKKKKLNFNRTIDFLFYNRNHENKKNNNIILLLNLLKNKYNIKIVGDNLDGFDNYGVISREKLRKILSNTKITFSTTENFYSFFVLDSIMSNCYVVATNELKKKINFFKKNFITINYNNSKKCINTLKYYLNKKNKLYFLKKDLKKIKQIELKFDLILKKIIKLSL